LDHVEGSLASILVD